MNSIGKVTHASKKHWWAWHIKEKAKESEFAELAQLNPDTINKIAHIFASHLNRLILKKSYYDLDKDTAKRLGRYVRYNDHTKHLSVKQLRLFQAYVEQTSKTGPNRLKLEYPIWSKFTEILNKVIVDRLNYDKNASGIKQFCNNHIDKNALRYDIFMKQVVFAIDAQLNVKKARRIKDYSYQLCSLLLKSIPQYLPHRSAHELKALVTKTLPFLKK